MNYNQIFCQIPLRELFKMKITNLILVELQIYTCSSGDYINYFYI